MFNNKNEVVFPLNSEWAFYSLQQEPENQIVDRSSLAFDDFNTEIPTKFSLSQNYPNPFNCSTIIEYSVDKPAKINLSVYNIRGELVDNLVNEYKSDGIYKFNYTSHLPSGLYFYRINTGSKIIQRKMVLLK